jgi:choline dehydrogenase-like flavoprotein
LDVDGAEMPDPDVIVIGSGVGGGIVARRLSEHGVNILLLERGQPVPREDRNWDVPTVFFDKHYKAKDTWYDRTGRPFDPGACYNLGGATKFYGAAMFRLRERDFENVEHHDGVSPAWPIRYADLESYYDDAEQIFGVHGDDQFDPTAPVRHTAYPFPAVPSEPRILELQDRLRNVGFAASALPLAVDRREGGRCILCATCDGFPCKLAAKNDAETCAVEPALRTGRVELRTGAYARRLILRSDGKRVEAVEVEQNGDIQHLSAPLIILAASAVNSAALLLRSACGAAPNGAANSSGVVGRHYMVHNQTALMGLATRRNPTRFQKTLAINNFYFGDDQFRYPMGQVQMLGKLQGGMLSANIPYLPRSFSNEMAKHSVDWIALAEDLPDPENRVTVRDNHIHLAVKLNNMAGHLRLVKKMKVALQKCGYPVVLTKSLVAHATAHQCGTVRFGDDPAKAALDPFCRSFDHPNLFVIDASFFPSSAAVNPALTIAAQALRAADHILKSDLGLVVGVDGK